MRCLLIFLAGALCATANRTQAEVRPAPLFSDGMVLQRDMLVPVWGTADKGETVTVSFCGQEVSAVAGEQGRWSVRLAKLKKGGPWPMTIRGRNTIEFKQVFVGDVWLCGGQSNMDMLVGGCDRAAEAMSTTTTNLHLSWGGGWQLAAGQANGGHSGTGYWFGRCLVDEMKDLHIGLIKCAVGGSTPEKWCPDGELYERLLKPLMPCGLKGVVWYQGESSTDRPYVHSQVMEAMIAVWRKGFENPALPFVYMQLPRIGGKPEPNAKFNPGESWALTREAQVFNLSIPNTAMAIFSDCSDGDLHPKAKPEAGKRLALAAMAKVYGMKPVENYLSPVLKKATLAGGVLTLSFDNAAGGLKVKEPAADGSIPQFIVVSEDGTQEAAKARIEGGRVLVDLRGEKGLPDVNYSFSNYPLGNLYNAAGLPVSPFRLARLKIGVEDCIGDTVTLSQDVPFGQHALKPDSYRIAGYKVIAAEYYPNSAYVRLRVNKPWRIGDKVAIELPGFREWDGATAVPPIEFIATPGRVAANGCFKEMLVGGLLTNVDFATCLKTNLVDVRAMEYPSAKVWKLVPAQGDGTISLLDTLAKLENALGFAHVYVYSAGDAAVNLWFGSDDGARVYVNKELVCTSEGVRPCIPDFVKVKNVKLRKGWNSVLFEIAQSLGGWAVMARIVDDNGKPVMGLGYQAEKPMDFR